MSRLSVIIPSRSRTNLEACVRAIRDNEPDIGHNMENPIIVVDDFEPEEHPLAHAGSYLERESHRENQGIIWCKPDPPKPFCFSRAINAGIKAADDHNDIIVLGDDGLLKTDRGFTFLSAVARMNPSYGIISAATNNVGNPNQRKCSDRLLREDPRMVCFIAVFISRQVINSIGLMDERFGRGGFEDDDFCLRARRAGFWIGVFDGTFVDHSTLPSTFRANGGPGYTPDGQSIFIRKWGFDNHGRDRTTSQWPHLFPPEAQT